MKTAFIFNCQRNKTQQEAEFDTPDTISAIKRGLKREENSVIEIEVTKDGNWIKRLADCRPDIVFSTAEGFKGVGRESMVPIICEQLGLPYVGCGPYACFLTLDKFLTKQVVSRVGVPTADGYYIANIKDLKVIKDDLQYPVFVKPNFEGSSKGISLESLCHNSKELVKVACRSLSEFSEGILIEKYIEGKDITVPYIEGLNGEGILEPIEYLGPKHNGMWIYDYDLKNLHDEEVGVKCPADIDNEIRKWLMKYTKKCVQVLAAADMGRADFRITPTGEIYFMEFNALPSLQPGAGIFEASKLLGLDYEQTIQSILSSGVKRLGIKQPRLQKSRRITTRNPVIGIVYNLKRKNKEDEDFELEAEYDSESTIMALTEAIASNGYQVIAIEATRELAQNLEDKKIDIVFNIAEGASKRAREAQVPAICDLLNIEHTGSDATCLAITLDKYMTSRLMNAEGIQTPRSKLYLKPPKKYSHQLTYPIIVKPNSEGTSKGVYSSSVVTNEAELKRAVEHLWKMFESPILCEQYIEGREFTVGILGSMSLQVFGPLEIMFKEVGEKYPVYSFKAKQEQNQRDNHYFSMVYPPDISPHLDKRIKSFAKKCFKFAGCRDVARIDLRVDHNNRIYFIEINPLPGLSPGFSDLTILAEKMDWKYEELIKTILFPAVRRWRKTQQSKSLGDWA